MKHVLIIGSGLSGLTCAIDLAENGIRSTLVSPYPSERAQSVMAAGGINAALGNDDSPAQHAEDTFKSGGDIAFVFKNDLIFVFGVVLPSAIIATILNAPAWVVFAFLKCDQILKCFVAVVKINRFNWMKNLTR